MFNVDETACLFELRTWNFELLCPLASMIAQPL
jgi:hypothetical protein